MERLENATGLDAGGHASTTAAAICARVSMLAESVSEVQKRNRPSFCMGALSGLQIPRALDLRNNIWQPWAKIDFREKVAVLNAEYDFKTWLTSYATFGERAGFGRPQEPSVDFEIGPRSPKEFFGELRSPSLKTSSGSKLKIIVVQ